MFAASFTNLLLVSLVEMLMELLLFFFTWGFGRGVADGVLPPSSVGSIISKGTNGTDRKSVV